MSGRIIFLSRDAKAAEPPGLAEAHWYDGLKVVIDRLDEL